ncbi:hypothetical protein F53441_12540 [Fusarium austroafricanum]|uniref:Uncharacterized protein n=1 Tax=Fusarium austroafricanum TaxID=2364996 RepID=A0A8H4JZ03_9HYPO|nr:hypothetical protein F53441_12540 [Fusarium austroafricanum]
MRRSKLLCLLALFVPLVAGLSRSRTQFQQWFPTPQNYSSEMFREKCSNEYREYENETLEDPGLGHKYSSALIDCILDKYGEANKANMAVTAILLALLPAGLAQFGPSMAEISLLSKRRPILATLLGFGLMSPNPNEFEYDEILDKAFNDGDSILPLGPLEDTTAGRILVSAFEYIIGMAVTGNLFYQIYRFTYQAISMAPLVVYLPGLPETATLFGWASLNLPIYLISFIVGALTITLNPLEPKRGQWARFIINELTPCGQGQHMTIEDKGEIGEHDSEKEKKRKRRQKFFRQTLGGGIRLIGGLHIILGTVLIGSIVLIPLGDSLPVIYSFVFAALTTRIVLSFEMNGLARRISNLEKHLAGKAREKLGLSSPKKTGSEDPAECQPFVATQKGYEGHNRLSI